MEEHFFLVDDSKVIALDPPAQRKTAQPHQDATKLRYLLPPARAAFAEIS